MEVSQSMLGSLEISVFSRPGHIDEEIIDDIFEPFITGSSRRRYWTEEAGLGLYIATLRES